jgi:hypothetical protein
VNTCSMTGQLYLNGKHVGQIAVRGWHGPWGFGDFVARAEFGQFEPLFDEWSRLMHANPDRLSRADAVRLREIENRTYALRARLWLVEAREWRHLAILNIDGRMIEWKEGWAGDVTHAAPRTAVEQPDRVEPR